MLPPKTPLANGYFRILHRLWRRGPAPTRALFQELNLSRTLGTRLVDQMADEGVVGPDPQTGALKILEGYGSVLGLHMGTGTVNAVLVSFAGELLLSRDFPFPDDGTPLVLVIQRAVAQMEPFLRSPDVPPLRGVAVSLPGVVDPYRLILLQSNPLKVTSPVALKEALGRPLGRPLTVENDANCCCWGEAVLHRRERLGNFLSILTEQRPTWVGHGESGVMTLGVGFGVYLNGSVYHGSRFSAGEFQSVFKLEPGVVNQFSVPDAVIARSYRDPEVGEALARELSRNASLLVNVLDLDRIYVSWPLADQAPRILQIMREEIRLNRSYDSPDCPVELPTMGFLAPAYGAAGLHLESLYQGADGPAPYFPGKN